MKQHQFLFRSNTHCTWTVCRTCRAYGSLHHKRIPVKIVLLGPRNSWLETLDCYSSGRPKETSYNYFYLQCSGINSICSHSVRLTWFSEWTFHDLPNHPYIQLILDGSFLFNSWNYQLTWLGARLWWRWPGFYDILGWPQKNLQEINKKPRKIYTPW